MRCLECNKHALGFAEDKAICRECNAIFDVSLKKWTPTESFKVGDEIHIDDYDPRTTLGKKYTILSIDDSDFSNPIKVLNDAKQSYWPYIWTIHNAKEEHNEQ